MQKTHTGSTNTRSYDSDKDAVAGELVRLGGGALLRGAILLALEDGERNHVESGGLNSSNAGRMSRT